MSLTAAVGGGIYGISFQKGLFLLQEIRGKLQFVLLYTASVFRSRGLLYTETEGSGDNYLLAEKNLGKSYGILRITRSQRALLKQIRTNTLGREVYQTRLIQGNLWVCFSNGAYFYANGDFGTPKTHLFEGEDISSVFQDGEGNYWFSSLGGGIRVVPSLEVLATGAAESSVVWHFTTRCLSPQGEVLLGGADGRIYTLNERQLLETLRIRSGSNRTNIYRRTTKILSYQGGLLISHGVLSIVDAQLREQVFSPPYIRDMGRIGTDLYLVTGASFGLFDLKKKQCTVLADVFARNLAVDSATQQAALSTNTGVQLYHAGRLWPHFAQR